MHIVDVDAAAAAGVEEQMVSGMRLKNVPFFVWEGGFSALMENRLHELIGRLG